MLEQIIEKIVGWVFTSIIASSSAYFGVKFLYEKRMAVAEKKIQLIKELSLEAFNTSRRAETAFIKSDSNIKFFVEQVKNEMSELTLVMSRLAEKIDSERQDIKQERLDLVRQIERIERIEIQITKLVTIIESKMPD